MTRVVMGMVRTRAVAQILLARTHVAASARLLYVVDLGDIWIVIDVLTSLFKGDPVLLEDDICWGYELVRTLQ